MKLHGSRKLDHRKKEPKPESGHPACPERLCDEAKAVWKGMVSILDGMRVLTKADGYVLTRYCQMYVRWWRATDFIEENGETYVVWAKVANKDGTKRVLSIHTFPQVHLLQHLNDAMLKVEAHFGLTPSSRARVEALPENRSESKGKARFFKLSRSG